MPIDVVRPYAPGQKGSDAQRPCAGRTFSFAVATAFVKPRSCLRPHAPGHASHDAHDWTAGRTILKAWRSNDARNGITPSGNCCAQKAS
jgi:hypothetical protein